MSVLAENDSGIDATLHSSGLTAGDGFNFSIAFNSLGWKAQNILFNAIDALLGDPLISSAFNGEQPAEVQAYVTDSTVTAGKQRRTYRVVQRPDQRHGEQRREDVSAALFGAGARRWAAC